MKKWYQIIYNLGGSSKSFEYFIATEKDAPDAAATLATAYKEKQQSSSRMFSYFKAPRFVQVKEYDNVSKKVIRGGHSFRLRLTYLKIKTNLRTIKEEWYTPEEVVA